MRVFFDGSIVVEEVEDGFIVYSPANHKWIKVDRFMHHLIKLITENNGFVDFKTIIESFSKTYGMPLTKEDVYNHVLTLVKSEIFFYSEDDLHHARTKAISSYCIPENQPLEIVYIHPTLRCNFSCSYCYNRVVDRHRRELTTSQWIDTIERLKSRGVTYVVVTGGEPLLRRDLLEIVKATKTDKMHFELLTNGSLLRDRLDGIISLFDRIIVSLDSDDPRVNTLNRSITAFQDIMSVLESCGPSHSDKVFVRSVITRHNCDDVVAFHRRLRDRYGIRGIRTWFLPSSPEEVHLIPNLDNVVVDEDQESAVISPLRAVRCGACYNIVAVDPSGDIYPCQSLLHSEFKITNILREDWYDTLLRSEIRKKFAGLSVDTMDKCNECPYRYFCGGGCPAVAYRVYGDLARHLNFFCEYLREMARSRLRLSNPEWEEVD